jgi:transcriptional regulator with XRE-family HTH domain
VILRIKLERFLNEWHQVDVATGAHITQQEVSLIEQGRLRPRPDQLERLGALFGVSPASALLTPVVVVATRQERPESRA